MTSQRPELSLAVIEDLKGKGFTQTEIAQIYDVTRQAVSWHKTYYGGRLMPREAVAKEFPFKVPATLSECSPFKRLRDHGEYVATRGIGMKKYKLDRLRAFYRKLRDEGLVLEYDPNIPPTPGVSAKGGWAFRERQPEDGNLLVRVNEFTTITEEGRRIWLLPPPELDP